MAQAPAPVIAANNQPNERRMRFFATGGGDLATAVDWDLLAKPAACRQCGQNTCAAEVDGGTVKRFWQCGQVYAGMLVYRGWGC